MGLCVQGRAARNRGLVTLGSKDRNLESPRKSTLDFREAGRDINDSRATRTKSHGRRLRGASPRYVHRASLRWISIHTDRPLQMTSPHPLRSRHSDFGGCASIPRDTRGRRPRQGAASGSTFPWDSGTAPEREARTNDYVPPSSTPSMIDEIMPSQSACFTVGTTRRQRMRCLSSLAWPPLL